MVSLTRASQILEGPERSKALALRCQIISWIKAPGKCKLKLSKLLKTINNYEVFLGILVDPLVSLVSCDRKLQHLCGSIISFFHKSDNYVIIIRHIDVMSYLLGSFWFTCIYIYIQYINTGINRSHLQDRWRHPDLRAPLETPAACSGHNHPERFKLMSHQGPLVKRTWRVNIIKMIRNEIASQESMSIGGDNKPIQPFGHVTTPNIATSQSALSVSPRQCPLQVHRAALQHCAQNAFPGATGSCHSFQVPLGGWRLSGLKHYHYGSLWPQPPLTSKYPA